MTSDCDSCGLQYSEMDLAFCGDLQICSSCTRELSDVQNQTIELLTSQVTDLKTSLAIAVADRNNKDLALLAATRTIGELQVLLQAANSDKQESATELRQRLNFPPIDSVTEERNLRTNLDRLLTQNKDIKDAK